MRISTKVTRIRHQLTLRYVAYNVIGIFMIESSDQKNEYNELKGSSLLLALITESMYCVILPVTYSFSIEYS